MNSKDLTKANYIFILFFMKRNIYTKNDAGNTFLLCILSPQVIGTLFVLLLLFYAFFTKTSYEELTKNSVVIFLMTILSQIIFIGIFFFYNKFFKINSKNACKANFKIGALNYIISIIIGLICLFGFNGITNCFSKLIEIILKHTPAEMPLPLNNGWWLLANLIFLALLPAIFEELIFRGMILNGLKQYGKIKAVIISALLFALIHGSIDQTLYPIILGLIFGIVAIKTNSIIPTILMHFINNSVVIIINYIYTIKGITETVAVDTAYVLISLAVAIAAGLIIFGLSFLLKNKTQPQVEEYDLQYFEMAKSKPNTCMTIGVIIGVLIWILALFV